MLYTTALVGHQTACSARCRAHFCFSGQAKCHAVVTIAEATATNCRQTLEGSVDVSLIGLGPAAEIFLVKTMTNVYARWPKVAERWAEFRKGVLEGEEDPAVLIKGRPQWDSYQDSS
ncbi:hypothetical protein WJX72_000926 [[Myrmecia] bisecta]|uniref:Uncharacterized protein n=1 Tax=[Myrmecia] bisecta TaxID=41462 RepID=A0AAW1PJ83_9CHLO